MANYRKNLSTEEQNAVRLGDLKQSCDAGALMIERVANSTDFDREAFLAIVESDFSKLKEYIRFKTYLESMRLKKECERLEEQKFREIQLELDL